jgi:hypothetical protein
MITTILTTLKSTKFLAGIGGYLLAAFLFWAWINGKEDLAAQREACNTAVQASAKEAERITRETAEAAFQARLAQKDAQLTSERNAREIADRRRQAAESRPAEVREVIRRIIDVEACLSTPVPVDILNSLDGL